MRHTWLKLAGLYLILQSFTVSVMSWSLTFLCTALLIVYISWFFVIYSVALDKPSRKTMPMLYGHDFMMSRKQIFRDV